MSLENKNWVNTSPSVEKNNYSSLWRIYRS